MVRKFRRDGEIKHVAKRLVFRPFLVGLKVFWPRLDLDNHNLAAPPKPQRPAPGISDDTRFYWEGARVGELRIQRCKACGTLRHPPGPVCPQCHSFDWDAVTASGRGTVYSFVVMHYPEVPPFEHPNPIALIELEEGTRLITQLVGVAPGDVRIGQKVQVEFRTYDGDLVLPQFRPVPEPT